MEKVWTPSLYNPLYGHPHFLSFFQTPVFGKTFRQYRPNEIPDKHKNKLMWQSYFLIFRRLKNNVTCFKKNSKQYQAEILFDKIIISSINRSKKLNVLNIRLDDERALLLQNPYIVNEKQCLPPPSIGNPTIWTTPHFYKKILIHPSMIFQKSHPPENKEGFTLKLLSIFTKNSIFRCL